MALRKKLLVPRQVGLSAGKTVVIILLFLPLVAFAVFYERGISALYGVLVGFGLGLANFVVAVGLGRWGIRKQTTSALVSVILSSFVVRLPLLVGALFLVSKVSWVDFYTVVFSFIVLYTILLFVEVKILSNLAGLQELSLRKE